MSLALGAVVILSGCAAEDDPLKVQKSVTFTDVRDETASDYYSVRDRATAVQDGVGARVTLGFDVSDSTHAYIDPIATIHWSNGTTSKCEADLRRLPALVDTLDTWDFECEPATFPAKTGGAYLVVVDDYQD
jgi:hypothetical protein